ncbi:MAG: hypothetical protein BJ554DRAFT_8188, partial [Olpidium bornovanus]
KPSTEPAIVNATRRTQAIRAKQGAHPWPNLAVYARPSRTRGYADHGWLKVRVVSAILSPHSAKYRARRSGLNAAEENEEQVDAVKFLQIWSDPGVNNLPCRYETKRFSDDRKLNRLLPIVVPKARARELDAIGLEADMYTYACLLESGQSVTLAANAGPGAATPRRAYVHVVDTGGKVRLGVPGGGDANAELASGDAAFVTGLGTDAPTVLEIRAVEAAADGKPVELLVFELPGKAEGVQQQ